MGKKRERVEFTRDDAEGSLLTVFGLTGLGLAEERRQLLRHRPRRPRRL